MKNTMQTKTVNIQNLPSYQNHCHSPENMAYFPIQDELLNDLCSQHNRTIIEYCKLCKKNLCILCKDLHINHESLNFNDISFDSNEINYFTKCISKYIETYKKLILEINTWKNLLESKIYELEKFINSQNDINNFNNEFLSSNFFTSLSFTSILRYRKLFYYITTKPNKIIKNNQILSFFTNSTNEYLKYKYGLSKLLLKELLNKNDFVLKSIEIIKYLNEFNNNNDQIYNNSNINSQINSNNIFSSNNINTKKLYVNYNIFPKNNTSNSKNLLNKSDSNIIQEETTKTIENKLNGEFPHKNTKKQKSVIEKHITFKQNNTINNNLLSQINETKPRKIEETEIKFDQNIRKSNTKKNNNNNLTNKFTKVKNFQMKEKQLKEIINNVKLINLPNSTNNLGRYTKKISKKNNDKPNYHKIIKSANKEGILNNSCKIFLNKNLSTYKDNDLIGYNFFQRENNNIPDNLKTADIKKIKVFINKNNNSKTYVHKNFLSKIKDCNNITKNDNIIEQIKIEEKFKNTLGDSNNSQESQSTEGILFKSIFNEDSNKINEFNINNSIIRNDKTLVNKNSTYNTANISLDNTNKAESSSPKNSNNNIIKIKNVINNLPFTRYKRIKNLNNNKYFHININKKKQNEIFKIKENKELYIGLELNNSECTLAFINSNNKNNNFDLNIENFALNDLENKFKIPTIISFDEKNNLIKIGEEAERMKIENPTQTIFNIIKFIGSDQNDITEEQKKLWPFKIYNDNKYPNSSFYVKINFNGEKNKTLYVSNILSIYLKKLFDIFFKKIKIDDSEKNSNEIKIFLIVTVPNYFTYYHKKLIEKIFKDDVFSYSLASYNNFNIILKSFKIENSSSISSICYNNKSLTKNNSSNNLNLLIMKKNSSKAVLTNSGNNTDRSSENNILIINIDGSSVNFSIVSITDNVNKIYEVKSIRGLKFGKEDFTDSFMNNCLSGLEYNTKQECFKSASALAKLRKSCELAESSFECSPKTEIYISKLYDFIELKMIVNKSDYEKACMKFYEQIKINIKKLIFEAKLKENDISDLILLGGYTPKLLAMIFEIFKNNKKILQKYENDKKNQKNIDELLVCSAAIHAFNINQSIPNYVFVDITFTSFGVENLNGEMEIIIEKGSKIPIDTKKNVKIGLKNKNEEFLYINIYEGENFTANKNKLISQNKIDKNIVDGEKISDMIYELLINFELDSNMNLNIVVLDKKTLNKIFVL